MFAWARRREIARQTGADATALIAERGVDAYPEDVARWPPVPVHFFQVEMGAWPPFPCDFLYSETEPFGLSAFGFLASLFPFISPFAMENSCRPRSGPESKTVTMRAGKPQETLGVSG